MDTRNATIHLYRRYNHIRTLFVPFLPVVDSHHGSDTRMLGYRRAVASVTRLSASCTVGHDTPALSVRLLPRVDWVVYQRSLVYYSE